MENKMKNKEMPDWLSLHLIETTTPFCYQPFDHKQS